MCHPSVNVIVYCGKYRLNYHRYHGVSWVIVIQQLSGICYSVCELISSASPAPTATADGVQDATADGVEAAAGEEDAGDAAAEEEEESGSKQPHPPVKTTFSIQD